MNETPHHPRTSHTRRPARRQHRTPPGTGTLGMWLFLAALTMLFGSTLVGYIIVRLRPDFGPPVGTIPLPATFWGSTAIILLASFTMHRAVQNVRAERQTRFRTALALTLLLSVAFLLLQAPGMAALLNDHFANTTTALYGLVFMLVIVHAAHVIGGLIPLGVITAKANQGRYDHEHHAPVKHIAMYWHFLDAVWIVMFFVLMVMG